MSVKNSHQGDYNALSQELLNLKSITVPTAPNLPLFEDYDKIDNLADKLFLLDFSPLKVLLENPPDFNRIHIQSD